MNVFLFKIENSMFKCKTKHSVHRLNYESESFSDCDVTQVFLQLRTRAKEKKNILPKKKVRVKVNRRE